MVAWRPNFETQVPGDGLFFLMLGTFEAVKKEHESLNTQKSEKWSDQECMLFESICCGESVSHLKVHRTNNKPLGKNTRLSSSLDPLTNKLTTHTSRSGQRIEDDETQTSLRAAWSPSERSLCNHRFVVDCGRPRRVTIFLSCCPRLGLPFFRWRTVRLQITPECTQNVCKHLGSETNDDVVPGCGVFCVDAVVRNLENLLCCHTFFQMVGTLHQ